MSGFKCAADALFAVHKADFYAELLMEMSSEVLGTVHRTVLSAGAAERKHQIGETAFDVALAMGIGKMVYGIEESEDFTIVLKESDYRLVHSRHDIDTAGIRTSGDPSFI